MKLAFTKKFLKQVSKLNNSVLAKEIVLIIDEAEKAQTLSQIKNLKKLKGHNNYYRIRTGDYRIGIYFNKDSFEFAAIDHRKDIYKYFP